MGRGKVWVGRLSDNELVAYSSIIVSMLVYGFGVFVLESSNIKKIISNSRGSYFGLNLSRDSSEHEWNNFCEKMISDRNIVYFLFIPVLDVAAKKFSPKFHKEVMILYSVIGLVRFFTIYGLGYTLVTSMVFYYGAKLKQKSVIWVVSVIFMYSVQDSYVFEFMGVKMNSNKINSYNEYVIIYYFMILRLISFSIDEIESRSGQNRGPIDFYSYILYPTVLTFAPFISFKKFLPCTEPDRYPKSLGELKWVTSFVIRILISALLIELSLRLTFTYSLVLYHQQFFAYFSKNSLIMAHVLRGTLFTAKYIVYYGFTSLINRFVGMSVSELPRCITLMHTNSELWRYFDTGLYEFIKNYLYIPLGGNKNYHLISLILSFGFVSYWHGFGLSISLWSAINCTMLIAESFYATYVLKQDFVRDAISTYSLRKKRVLLSLLLAVWQLIMYLNASLFLDPIDSTVSFYDQYFLNSSALLYVPLVYFCFYCLTQLRLEFVDFYF